VRLYKYASRTGLKTICVKSAQNPGAAGHATGVNKKSIIY
jgi:hypothetical protein